MFREVSRPFSGRSDGAQGSVQAAVLSRDLRVELDHGRPLRDAQEAHAHLDELLRLTLSTRQVGRRI